MKKLRAVIWTHPQGGPAALKMLARCDLRHLAEQETGGWVHDDNHPEGGWLSGDFGYVRLQEDDPRLTLLLAELEAVHAQPTVRTEVLYSAKERKQSPWLTFSGSTSMVSCDIFATQWTHEVACPICNAGALPGPEIVLQHWKMPKTGLACIGEGVLIATSPIAKALIDAKLTGFTTLPVLKGKKPRLDPDLLALRIESTMPAWDRRTKTTGTLCSACARLGHSEHSDWTGLWYKSFPRDMKDFNRTREEIGSVTPRNKYPGCGAPFIIFSQRAREVLSHAGVRLTHQPVHLAPPASDAP